MRTAATESTNAKVLGFLGRLDEHRVPYALAHVRPHAIMVQFALPGERWEVEFLVNGSADVERFRSDGAIGDATAIDELWVRLAADVG